MSRKLVLALLALLLPRLGTAEPRPLVFKNVTVLDMTNTQKIAAVVLHGRLIAKPEIEKLLDAAEKPAEKAAASR